ncbi:zinc-ribbon domain-containing protein [Ralstonia mannitolilytica]|uniref:zinc-ribbon domain-containing protein n=2 Tax=Ralstonia mannitolilytica TaxID=105219 RepID=UPI0026A97738
MFCPTCNTQNSATSVSCIQCGTTLIYEAKGHSASYIKGARLIDSKIYSIVGILVCFGFAFILLNTFLSEWSVDERLVYLASIVVGGIAGRVIAWRKWRSFLQASKSSP